MNKFAKRLKKSIGLDLTTAAVLGGVALATTFAAAQAWDVLTFATEHVAVYGATDYPIKNIHTAAPAKPPMHKAALRKALRIRNVNK